MGSATMEGEGIAQVRLMELGDADAPQRRSPSCLDAVPDTSTRVSDSQPERPRNPATMDDTEHPSDERDLLDEDESSDDNGPYPLRSKQWFKSKWWFQHRRIRKNWRVVLCSYIFVLFGMALVCTGIILEAVQVVEAIRGLVLVVMGIVVIVPSCFGVLSVYLAARRCCSLSLADIKFFSD